MPADIEGEQRERNIPAWEPMSDSALAKPKPCRSPKQNATIRSLRGKAALAALQAHELRGQQQDAERDP
jgi:hypothetical protein